MRGTVGIIGAGIAGLCTAKTLKEIGFSVTIFEKEADVGGVWSASRRYPGLTTQNPRETYAFSDFPMPDSFPEWPTGAQMQAYLEAYAQHFELMPHIRLETLCVAATPLPEGKGWSMRSRGSDGVEREDRFDWLILCNGIFSIPAIPNFPGADVFTANGGKILHTSQFTDVEWARDRDVLVVGYGKSSCDCANALTGISRSTTVVARSLIWKIPKKLAGKLNFKHLFLTRMGEGLFRYIDVKGFEAFLHGIGRPLRNTMLGSVEGVINRQLKLEKVNLHPDKPLETIARSTVSLVSDGFYDKVAKGIIKVVKNSTIAKLEPGKATLSTGAVLPADLIVCGTGWDQRAAFLPDDVLAKVTDAVGNFRLYRSIVPLGVPRLLFNGYNSSFFSQLNAEVGAMWIAEFITGRLKLPSEAEQIEYIDSRLAWMEERTGGKHCKGTNIVPFSLHHIDELLADIDLTLPVTTRIAQWMKSVDARQFEPLTKKLIARHKKAA